MSSRVRRFRSRPGAFRGGPAVTAVRLEAVARFGAARFGAAVRPVRFDGAAVFRPALLAVRLAERDLLADFLAFAAGFARRARCPVLRLAIVEVLSNLDSLPISV